MALNDKRLGGILALAAAPGFKNRMMKMEGENMTYERYDNDPSDQKEMIAKIMIEAASKGDMSIFLKSFKSLVQECAFDDGED